MTVICALLAGYAISAVDNEERAAPRVFMSVLAVALLVLRSGAGCRRPARAACGIVAEARP
jgi:hypothetical protein